MINVGGESCGRPSPVVGTCMGDDGGNDGNGSNDGDGDGDVCDEKGLNGYGTVTTDATDAGTSAGASAAGVDSLFIGSLLGVCTTGILDAVADVGTEDGNGDGNEVMVIDPPRA